MSLRDLGLYVRGRINSQLSRVLNARAAPVATVPVDEILARERSPLGLVGLLEGRPNPEREAAVARYLEGRGIAFTGRRFATFEGRGENFCAEVGAGDRVLLLIAHHDAVPGSPGANDNAAAVAILLHLLERLVSSPPRGLRVRCLFTACEELGYLGARAWVDGADLADVTGVLSLELCGIGDSLAVWDAVEETPFLRRVCGAFENLGLSSDESYHVVGRIPLFGSDHRAFAASGVPAYGLSVVPSAHAEALRRFVFSPLRSAFRHLVRRPPPFDTYHTPRDRGTTLEPAALALTLKALEGVVADVG